MPLTPTSNEQATQTLAVGIQRLVSPKIASTIFRNKKLFGVFPQTPSRGDLAYRWPVHFGGNTSAEAYVSGQAFPESGNQQYTYADLLYATGYHRGVFAIDGHMRDALRTDADVFGVIQQESTRVVDDILDLLHTACLGTGLMGLQLAVDSAGTYAGIARGAAIEWRAEENAATGGLQADMELMYQELTDAEHACRCSLIMVSPTVATAMRRMSPSPGGPTIVMNSAPGGGPVHLDVGVTGQSFNGIPVLEMPDLTATVMLWLDVAAAAIEFIEHRPLEVNLIGRRMDAQEYDVSLALLLKVGNPFKCGKITGI